MITYACSGRCRHCSEGEHISSGEHIDGDKAAEIVRKVSENYKINSLMTFGGEPLLYPEAVCKIHSAAQDMGIPERTIITNGFFSRDTGKINSVAGEMVQSGVNDILLSVDAFHQETIPIEPVTEFAKAAINAEVPRLRAHPAWLVNENSDNPYNNKTREILSEFQSMGIEVSAGNVIFPSGNSLKYLKEYFSPDVSYENPYAEDSLNIRTLSVSPNGDVLDGNIYKTDILEILENYAPF